MRLNARLNNFLLLQVPFSSMEWDVMRVIWQPICAMFGELGRE